MGGFYRFIRGLMIALSKTLFPCKVYGKENIPETGGFVLCSNHTSMSDVIFIIASNKRQVHFMGKAEIFDNKIMAFLYGKMGVFPVKRGAHDTSAVKYAEDLGKEGKIVGIFPEGTRRRDFGPPMQGKSGAVVIAASAGVPILPCAIYREGKFRIFRKTVIRYGKPIENSELPDVKDGKNAIRAALARLMGDITELWRQGK